MTNKEFAKQLASIIRRHAKQATSSSRSTEDEAMSAAESVVGDRLERVANDIDELADSMQDEKYSTPKQKWEYT